MNNKLIEQARKHRAELIAAEVGGFHAAESEARRILLADWAPHIEAIRAALPAEAQDGIQEPRNSYQFTDQRWCEIYAYTAVEIKVGPVSVWAWHYTPRGEQLPSVSFAPGLLSYNADNNEIYNAPLLGWRNDLDECQTDFLLALALADQDFELHHAHIVRRAERRPDPAPEPTTGELLEALIKEIVADIIEENRV